MPVDDAELENMLKSAHSKLDSNEDTRSKLKIFIGACDEIKKTKASDGKMEVKKDRYLGTKLAESRRQAIYDKLLIDKTTLGL